MIAPQLAVGAHFFTGMACLPLRAAHVVDAMGFDPVDAGPFVNGRMFGPGTQIFNGGWRTAEQIARILNRRTDYPALPFELD